MFHNPLLQKLVQISEEALPPVHVPLILGNDFFVLTQQDVRKIEDCRLFSISKVMPNGDLRTINPLDVSVYLQSLSRQENLSSHKVVNNFLEFLKRNFYQECQEIMPQQQQQYYAFNDSCPQPMEVSLPTNTVASIGQQLEWNKCENVSTAFPLHYSSGTSTTEIDFKPEIKDKLLMTCNDCKIYPLCENRISCSNKSTNTQDIKNVCNKKSNEPLDAREQLKKKKLRYLFA